MANLTDDIRQRIAKVQELVSRGATEGERAAAQAALDRLVKTYDISEETLENIELEPRYFSYKWNPEKELFFRILSFVIGKPEITQQLRRAKFKPAFPGSVGWVAGKYLTAPMRYDDYIVASCAYEYFRRHMKAQWETYAKAELNRCRKVKTRRAKRLDLEPHFVSCYMIASGLYRQEELVDSNHSRKEAEAARLFRNVEGGQYKTQVERSGYFLES